MSINRIFAGFLVVWMILLWFAIGHERKWKASKQTTTNQAVTSVPSYESMAPVFEPYTTGSNWVIRFKKTNELEWNYSDTVFTNEEEARWAIFSTEITLVVRHAILSNIVESLGTIGNKP